MPNFEDEKPNKGSQTEHYRPSTNRKSETNENFAERQTNQQSKSSNLRSRWKRSPVRGSCQIKNDEEKDSSPKPVKRVDQRSGGSSEDELRGEYNRGRDRNDGHRGNRYRDNRNRGGGRHGFRNKDEYQCRGDRHGSRTSRQPRSSDGTYSKDRGKSKQKGIAEKLGKIVKALLGISEKEKAISDERRHKGARRLSSRRGGAHRHPHGGNCHGRRRFSDCNQEGQRGPRRP